MEVQTTAPNDARRTLHVLLLGLAVGAGTLVLLKAAESLGANIPQDAIGRDYAVGVVWALVLGAGILLWPVSAVDKLDLLVLWGVKCVVTLGFMLLYESFYGWLDAFGYFVAMRFPGMREVGSEGSGLIVSLAAIQDRVIPNSYHALKVSCSMLGLIGVYLFYRAGVLFLGRPSRRLFYALALFPSVLFWSSIFGKDPIVLLGIAMYSYGVISWVRRGGVRSMVWTAAGIVVASAIRPWLAPILVVPLLVTVWLSLRRPMARVALAAAAGLLFAVAAARFAAATGIGSPQQLLEVVSAVSQAWAQGGSAQKIPVDLTSVRGVMIFVPLGAFTALFRPLPGEIMNPFGLLAGIENMVLLGLLALSVVRLRMARLRDPLVLWAIAFVGTWATVYGFISYQNLGAGVRFKLQILPVLIGLLLYMARKPERAGEASPTDFGSDVRI